MRTISCHPWSCCLPLVRIRTVVIKWFACGKHSIPCVGWILISPSVAFLFAEENTVRDAASASAQAISEILPQETFQNQYASMLSRLATKEWFTARISSASLIASAYLKLTAEQQQEHLTLFAQLCQDDTPMVRRVAAQYLGIMVQNVVQAVGRKAFEETGQVTTILIPLYEELASNEQPVRTNIAVCGKDVIVGARLLLIVFYLTR
jgi:serine/threonine-protein phosphatase 2A regulatory subunit A